jgi:hypothetical protein
MSLRPVWVTQRDPGERERERERRKRNKYFIIIIFDECKTNLALF